jgi:hypothetical protein
MPGWHEPLGEFWEEVQAQRISAIVNLAPDDES